MSADETGEEFTLAERRLAEHLELLRASPPITTPQLVPRVIRGVRWQRAVRDPFLLVGAVAAALLESLGVLVKPPTGKS